MQEYPRARTDANAQWGVSYSTPVKKEMSDRCFWKLEIVMASQIWTITANRENRRT
jgi:hypothetical protein